MADGEPAAVKSYAAFIWSVADLLRGDYRRSEYGRVILPLTVIRRLDCVLEPTKSKVLAVRDQYGDRDALLRAAAGVDFYNTSRLTLTRILGDPATIADQLRAYLAAFSPNARDVIDNFDFTAHIARLNQSNLLYLVLSKFCDLDLHPDAVSNVEMGAIYEELIRRSFEAENETAGEHFTPREVIRLMVDLLFCDDDALLGKRGIVKTLFDPACGTGGMLSVAEDRLRELNPAATLEVHGQELNARTYAICRSDMMIKGEDADNIAFGNSFTSDAFEDEHFDYLLANPPFGVEWKKVADEVRREQTRGFGGRFGAGLPRINDGSFLFLQHMISKMKRTEAGGSRLAIVFNGSPLFTGAAGSGESEIRRWIIENDWLEAVVALPDKLFYNTGISTYFWVVTNRKSPQRRGKVQLIDGREFFTKMRKSLGEKRKEISAAQIGEIVRHYGDFAENDKVKIMPNGSFGFLRCAPSFPDSRLMVNLPLRAAGPDTRRGLAAGSCTEVQSADVGNCTGTRCTGQRHDMRAIGSDIEYGGLARSSGQRRTIRPSSYRSKSPSGLPNAGAYASSASWRTGWMYSCCRDPNGRSPGRQEYGCGRPCLWPSRSAASCSCHPSPSPQQPWCGSR